MLILHTFYYALARGLPAVIGFLSISLYTHLLTPEQYGTFVVAVAYATVIDGFIFQWLRLSTFRYYPVYESDIVSFLNTVIRIFSTLVLSSLCLTIVFWLLLPELSTKQMIPAVTLIMCSKAWFELNQTMANVSMAPRQYGIQGLSRALISLLVGGLLAYLGYGALALILGVVAGNLFYSLIARNHAWNKIDRTSFNPIIAKELFHYGIPLTGTVLLSAIVAATDRLMLGWFCGNTEAGLFAASYDITKNVLGIIMMIITLGTKPHAVRALEQGDMKIFSEKLAEQFTLLITISIPTAAVLAACAPNVSTVLLGKEFHQSAVELIPLISVVALMMGIKSYYFDLSFQLSGETAGQLKVMIQAAILHTILNLALVPPYGKMGAVHASILTFAFAIYISARDGRKVLALPIPLNPLIKVSLISLIIYTALVIEAIYYHGVVGLAIQAFTASSIFGVLVYYFDLMDARRLVAKLLTRKKVQYETPKG